ncbi:chaperonin CPN60-2, mitochondrial precursor [Iris pallida]|uniref:Chaperonin CPN60-2, mitochondrial n=1 Tax=Iris pallida TaxID=29817 RepID=A0AAX6G5E6_IRIPA|nr:chaperonin CPN60-2, mitochondrial precursor [Iris pallida]
MNLCHEDEIVENFHTVIDKFAERGLGTIGIAYPVVFTPCRTL